MLIVRIVLNLIPKFEFETGHFFLKYRIKNCKKYSGFVNLSEVYLTVYRMNVSGGGGGRVGGEIFTGLHQWCLFTLDK
jgi:hypothetical protein